MFTYLKLKLLRRCQKRFVPHQTKISNYTVFYKDPRSLFSEYKLIFKDKIYHFESRTDSPLIIDGGGHIGLATLYFKKLYPDSEIIIFEPDKETLPILKKNLQINDIKNVKIHEVGLSNKEGTVKFQNTGTDSAKLGLEGNGVINVGKLSNYIDKPVDFMKLNIEGEELSVLKDLEETNKLGLIKQLCVEWHSFAGQEQDLGEFLSILERNKFRYLINHFDYRVNPRLKPPFQLSDKTQYYLLVYATKI